MSRRRRLLTLLDRLTAFVPGPPSMRPDPSTVPDADDTRATPTSRRARRRLWSLTYEKRGKGGYR